MYLKSITLPTIMNRLRQWAGKNKESAARFIKRLTAFDHSFTGKPDCNGLPCRPFLNSTFQDRLIDLVRIGDQDANLVAEGIGLNTQGITRLTPEAIKTLEEKNKTLHDKAKELADQSFSEQLDIVGLSLENLKKSIENKVLPISGSLLEYYNQNL